MKTKILFLTSLAVLFLSGSALGQGGLRGYSCPEVRQAVVRYGGVENAVALARAQGGSDREISAARRCLSRPKHFRRS